jgi:hypothetical protein
VPGGARRGRLGRGARRRRLRRGGRRRGRLRTRALRALGGGGVERLREVGRVLLDVVRDLALGLLELLGGEAAGVDLARALVLREDLVEGVGVGGDRSHQRHGARQRHPCGLTDGASHRGRRC